MSDLSTLEPRRLWGYFLELSRIPRGSKNEAAAARWAAEQARRELLDQVEPHSEWDELNRFHRSP